MMSILRLIACCAALVLSASAHALENAELVAADSPHGARRHAAPATEEARNDNGMQAVCHEVLFDTDEGYGVTNREARVICDPLR